MNTVEDLLALDIHSLDLKNLKEGSREWTLKQSNIFILKSKVMATSKKACRKEARKSFINKKLHIHKRLLQKIQSDAVQVLNQCKHFGMNEFKPYFIQDNLVYGFFSFGNPSLLFDIGVK